MKHVIYCCKCGRVALRVVGKDGYCGEHTKEAFEAAAAENARHGHGKQWDDFRGTAR